MKQSSTLLLRGSIVFIGLVILALCVFVLPPGIIDHDSRVRSIVIGLYATAIPFYGALYQGWKLLGYIDQHKAFSNPSVRALTIIKYCASCICALYIAGLPYLHALAQGEDAPGFVLFGLIIVFATFVGATLTALLQKLLQQAVAMKAENELTV